MFFLIIFYFCLKSIHYYCRCLHESSQTGIWVLGTRYCSTFLCFNFSFILIVNFFSVVLLYRNHFIFRFLFSFNYLLCNVDAELKLLFLFKFTFILLQFIWFSIDFFLFFTDFSFFVRVKKKMEENGSAVQLQPFIVLNKWKVESEKWMSNRPFIKIYIALFMMFYSFSIQCVIW